jgi:hypothetical protein
MPPSAESLRRGAARAVYEAGTSVGRFPKIVMPIARRRGQGEPLDEGTEIVIEGFPRSANTLMVATFARSQSRAVRIAHHVHAPAHVLEAIRRGLPALVLIREPEQAVVDLVAVKPQLTIVGALRGWLRFYAPLVRHRESLVVATAAEVHEDPAAPIRRINERFGTSFALPAEEAHRTAIEDVARNAAPSRGPGLPLIGRTSRVAGAEAEERPSLLDQYRSRRATDLRRRAEALYRTFVAPGSAGVPPIHSTS